jgi:CHAT domain-containing protein
VKNLIVSLWDVPDDKTKELMVIFYRKLFETGSIRQSLNLAQREMAMKGHGYKDWSGFVLIR